MKIVYIAHPMRGDIQANTLKVLSLLKKYHTSKILPIAPYILSCQYLDDDNPSEREKGIEANVEYFERGVIDELWVCGEESVGVKAEIELAKKLNIPVVWKNTTKKTA